MLRVIILNGSPRKHGATAKILHKMRDILNDYEDMEVSYVDISDINMKPCQGCCYCYKEGRCFIEDDAELLSKQIEHADGIIIGSPTYSSNISGQLKEFIDRGHFVIEQLLADKYAISVITGENYGNKDAGKILNKILTYSGAQLSGKLVYKLPFNSDPFSSNRVNKDIKKTVFKFNKDMREKNSRMIQKMKHSIIFHYGIRPFVEKKGSLYQGVVERWNRL